MKVCDYQIMLIILIGNYKLMFSLQCNFLYEDGIKLMQCVHLFVVYGLNEIKEVKQSFTNEKILVQRTLTSFKYLSKRDGNRGQKGFELGEWPRRSE